MPYLSAMGLFRRNTKYRVEGPPTPVAPGHEFAVTLHASRVSDDTTIDTVYADVMCSGRKASAPTQSEALQASSVSSYLRVSRREIEVNRTLAQPEDSVELKVWLPWWAPVVRVGDQKLMGSPPYVKLGHLSYGQVGFESEALPFHHAMFEVADQLGWTYERCETWHVGGTKRPVEQQLWFSAGDDFEGQGFKLAHVEVVPIAGSEGSGDLQVTVYGRKLGPGLFPLGRLDRVPLTTADPTACTAALRSGLTDVIAGARIPGGVQLDGQVLETLVRVLLQG